MTAAHSHKESTKSKTITSRQPNKRLVERVRKAFDGDKLIDLCETWDFESYATRVDLPDGRFYYYRDNGSNVLAIAHLDSVQDDVYCQVTSTAAGLLATSGALDDRLGVYVILELLPKLGITCDWLLTTDEEIGRSTASDFVVPEGKNYDWMFQFDRAGTDVVMYDYETSDLCKRVEAAGYRVGQGSYSDICMLNDLGVAGFNFGVGYADYHSARSHAWLEDTFRSVARFINFYKANKGTRFKHKPVYRHVAASLKDDWLGGVDGLIEADCGHLIDLENPASFVKWGSGGYLICTRCQDDLGT